MNWNAGNINTDPLFNRDGLHLRVRSPCRNAGDAAAAVEPTGTGSG